MKIGLAFGGGGTRGLAHLGVLSVLVEQGFQIDFVAGCSAGSVIGAVYCAGIPMEEMKKMAAQARWKMAVSRSRSRGGIVSFAKLERWLTMFIGDLDFSVLSIPLAVVTVDAATGERIVLREGRVARAVHASCAVPGIVEPVQVDKRMLVDGGIVDNLPVAAARELGADYVIGIDVFEPDYQREGGAMGRGLAAIESLIRHAGGGYGAADFLITPKTAGYSFFRFRQYHDLVALGEQSARERLPALLASLNNSEQLAL